MRVAILTPMPSELAPVVETLGLTRATDDGPGSHRGRVAGAEVVALRTGVGTAAARQVTEHLLDTLEVDHVIVVGIAGGIGASQVGDLIVPDQVVDHATGRAVAPHPIGTPRPAGTIMTSDELLIDPDVVATLATDGVVALDMETAAVGMVCEEREQPWSAIRAISDRAEDHTDDAVLGLLHPDGSPNLAAVARFFVTRPHRIPRLVRLGRGARVAAHTAARATLDALRAHAP